MKDPFSKHCQDLKRISEQKYLVKSSEIPTSMKMFLQFKKEFGPIVLELFLTQSSTVLQQGCQGGWLSPMNTVG